MKVFYILLNIFLFILAVLLFAMNLSFKPHLPDRILSSAPDMNKAMFAVKAVKAEREPPPNPSALWENNLFSPYRSGDSGPLLGAGARPVGMELLGVCRFGDVAGAIILDKQASAAPASPQTRLRGPRSTGSAVVAPQGGGGNAPKFCKLGEQLDNGFTLTEVTNDTAVLSRGREQIVLKIDPESEASIQRNASAAEAAAAASAKLEATMAAQQPQPPQPGANPNVQLQKGVKPVPSVPLPNRPGVTQPVPAVQPAPDDQNADGQPPATVRPE